MGDPVELSFWASLVKSLKWLSVKILAPGIALALVIGGILLVAMGWKELQIGGILGSLLGKLPSGSPATVVNDVPGPRVDANGAVIPEGQADSKGDTQAVVVPIQTPGLFSNPSTVTFTSPGDSKPTVVSLPTGVKAKDVSSVIVVQPGVVAVTVKDSSGVSTKTVDDLLTKYSS